MEQRKKPSLLRLIGESLVVPAAIVALVYGWAVTQEVLDKLPRNNTKPSQYIVNELFGQTRVSKRGSLTESVVDFDSDGKVDYRSFSIVGRIGGGTNITPATESDQKLYDQALASLK